MTNFKFKKKYGQNFLQDKQVIDMIAESINPTENDLILEIGPGVGALTTALKKHPCHILAIEIDEETESYLKELEDEQTHIIYTDFLSLDLKELLKDFDYEKLFILGNLPYYITTPIIEHIIDSKIPHESLTIMVQKEVAERFLARPGHREYGYMTVLLNYHYKMTKITDVSKEKFYPSPKVDSAVVKLEARPKENVDYEKFKTLLKASFQFKRKTIGNNLKNYDGDTIEKVLANHGYTLQDRAENIDLNTFIELTNVIAKK